MTVLQTSLDAKNSLGDETVDQLRSRIFVEVRERGGATCDEIEVALGLRHQTASARIRELVEAGKLVDSDERRPTRSGRDAVVWTEATVIVAPSASVEVVSRVGLPLTLAEVEHRGGYQIVYADPPWQYAQGGRGAAGNHYGTTGISGIAGLPVHRVASENSVLFVWVTWPFLRDVFTVIDYWGFTYKTCAFVWVKYHENSGKRCVGGGFWTRANTEFCLLCVRGDSYPRRLDTTAARGVRQLIEEWPEEPEELLLAPRQDHSAKPAEARSRIRQLLGSEPSAIELFARCTDDSGKIVPGGRVAPGWDQWGNECDADIYMGVSGEEVRLLEPKSDS